MESEIVREVMTSNPVTVGSRQTLVEAAQLMRDHGIGDVIVADEAELVGILTDRDIVVRAVADAREMTRTEVGAVCTRDVASVGPDDPADTAVDLMSSKAIRRLPVVEEGKVVGVVVLGDLAVDREPRSALADITVATPNN
jgi:CBS domain-containing protein